MSKSPTALTSLQVPVPKSYKGGTHRMIGPEETIARVRSLMPVLGITRIANVTGLDRIGVPVVVVCRPNSRSLAVSQGKGLDLAAARASALMESIESWHGEHIYRPLKLGSVADLYCNHRLADVAELPQIESSLFHYLLPLLWIEGWDIVSAEPVWLPFELVSTNYTLPQPTGFGCFVSSSNGLASGNHVLEAISHGLCEVVERDAAALWHLLSPEQQAATRIDLDSIDDAGCQHVLDCFAKAEVDVGVWEITSDVAIPAFMCVITEKIDALFHPVQASAGMGCHVTRAVALLRALTEAAQSRLTVISGSRDDIIRSDYQRTRSPDVLRRARALLELRGPMRSFEDGVGFDGDTLNDDVTWAIDRLSAAGLDRVIVTDLSRAEFGVPVVRVVVPGLEGPYQLTAYTGYTPGPRARARMRAAQ